MTIPYSKTSELVGYSWRYLVQSNSNGSLDTFSPRGFKPLGTNTLTGAYNPGWKDLVRTKSGATTLLVATSYDGDLERSNWSWFLSGDRFVLATGKETLFTRQVGTGFIQYPVLPSVVSVPTSVALDVRNRAIRKLIQEVNSARSSENLTGRSIRHFKHDMHSLIHPMQGIQDKVSDYLTSLKKVSYGKLKGASLLSTVREAYLEFKFGVQPFTVDVTDIMSDLVVKGRKRTPTVPVEATASQTFAGSSGAIDLNQFSNTGCAVTPNINVSITSKYSIRFKGAVVSGINEDGRIGLVQDNRLLPSDWAPTLFSIMPYAWMVNYFTNIGDLIDAASFDFQNLAWCNETIRTTNVVEYSNIWLTGTPLQSVTPPGFQDFITMFSEGGNAIFRWKQVTRALITPADLVPTFEFSIPKSPTPWLNMMAAFLPRIQSIERSLFR